MILDNHHYIQYLDEHAGNIKGFEHGVLPLYNGCISEQQSNYSTKQPLFTILMAMTECQNYRFLSMAATFNAFHFTVC